MFAYWQNSTFVKKKLMLLNIESIREYCIAKAYTTESFPFDEVNLVLKVYDKMFAILSLDSDFTIILKCDPDYALELREKYNFVQPGYHMNKTHWNTIYINEIQSPKLLCEWIDHSYWLVVSKLNKMKRLQIEKAN